MNIVLLTNLHIRLLKKLATRNQIFISSEIKTKPNVSVRTIAK